MGAAARLLSTSILALVAATACAADEPRCADPIQDTAATTPSSGDCFFILRAAVGAAVCDPECICDPGLLPGITVEDALVCLQRSLGLDVPLDCRCPWETSRVEDLSNSDFLSYSQYPWFGFCPFSAIASATISRSRTGAFELALVLFDDASRCYFNCYDGYYGECPSRIPEPTRTLTEEEVEAFRAALRRFEFDTAVDPSCPAMDPPFGFAVDAGGYSFQYPDCYSPQLAGNQLGRLLVLFEKLREASRGASSVNQQDNRATADFTSSRS